MLTPLEHQLVNTYKDRMILFLETHPQCFDEAVELATGDKQPFSWRAAWLLWSCMKDNDARIKKYTGKIVNSIKDKTDGHQRELIKILSRMKLSDKHEGILFNICLNAWEDINKTPSVRITAFKFIVGCAAKHPELKKEILFLTQNHYLETLSPGVKRSVSKMIDGMERMNE